MGLTFPVHRTAPTTKNYLAPDADNTKAEKLWNQGANKLMHVFTMSLGAVLEMHRGAQAE